MSAQWLHPIAVAAALSIAVPTALQAQRQDTLFARVTYVSGASVYIDAGQRNGLTEAAAVDVVRGGSVVARLRVRFLSPARSQCDILSATAAPLVGDSVRYVRVTLPMTPAKDTTSAVSPTAPPRSEVVITRERPIRGRVGFRNLAAWQRDSGDAQLAQLASDARIEGALPGIPSLDFSIDARARRTRTIAVDGIVAPSRMSTLVYQSWIGWRASPGTRVRVGRQYSTELSAVSLFDGALVAFDRPNLGVGGFVGTQPDAETMGYSTRVREYGAYGIARVAPWPTASGALSTGIVSSYDGGQVDRDFAFATVTWYDRIMSVYVTQELDYNRGWKRLVGEPAVTPTSTYASLRVRPFDAVELFGGYDSRRSVRLYRNYVSPAIAFDDRYRTGVWAGITVQPPGRASGALDVRHSKGAAQASATGSDAADVLTVTAALRDLWYVAVSARGRTSYFRSPAATGWLQTITLSGAPFQAVQVDVGGGLRREVPAPGTASAAVTDRFTAHWLEVSLDFAVGRSWYLQLSGSRERGGWEASDQIYSALSYRF